MQRIVDMPQWYEVARYLAASPGGKVRKPTKSQAKQGMAEALRAIRLSHNIEDEALAWAITRGANK